MSNALKIIFAGTPEFAAVALRALIDSPHEVCAVYTQPDRPAGRGRKLQASPVKALALEHSLPVHQPPSLRDAQEQERLAALGADVMVVAAYGLILPKAVLEVPRLGCINIHASLLPRWRGAAPVQRAILAGDAESGVTIMQMDRGLDTGDMLLKVSTAITSEDTAQSLHDRLAELGAGALLEALEGVQAGTLAPQPQDDTLATYAAKLEKGEAEIDWSQPAEFIERQVRAFNPWPVAQTTLEAETLRIWQSRVLPEQSEAPPGSIISTSREGIDVATGSGVLRLLRLQPSGKRPMSAAEFLNARRIQGGCFGRG